MAIRFLMAFSSNAINATLYEKLNFNFIRDIAPVAGVIRVPEVMLANPTGSAPRVAKLASAPTEGDESSAVSAAASLIVEPAPDGAAGGRAPAGPRLALADKAARTLARLSEALDRHRGNGQHRSP